MKMPFKMKDGATFDDDVLEPLPYSYTLTGIVVSVILGKEPVHNEHRFQLGSVGSTQMYVEV